MSKIMVTVLEVYADSRFAFDVTLITPYNARLNFGNRLVIHDGGNELLMNKRFSFCFDLYVPLCTHQTLSIVLNLSS